MATVTVTIQNQKGLHARAAAKFVKLAEQFKADIWVEKKDPSSSSAKVIATSIMGLMMLAASIGTELNLSADGPDADQALQALDTLVNDKFGEE